MNLPLKRPFLSARWNGAAGEGIHGEATMKEKLKSPFPAFGGKQKVASLIWSRIGDVDNAIEPFCLSAAWLLARPHPPRVETLNDVDCMVANFWRATQQVPEAVALYADGPVNEADLHARHRWLVLSDEAAEFRQRMRTDPFYFDPLVAGWWVWGACCWIGGGWCVDPEHGAVNGPVGGSGERSPKIGNQPGNGIHARDNLSQQMPKLSSEDGVLGTPSSTAGGGNLSQEMPKVSEGRTFGGTGVHGDHRPQLADAFARGRGVHGNDAADHYLSQSMPHLGQGSGEGPGNGAGRGVNSNAALGTCASRHAWLLDWFWRLRDRLRTVRVCCGHWLRVCDSESVTTRLGTTGLFLDPPYPTHSADGQESRSEGLYATDGDRDDLDALRDEVLAYCKDRGPNPQMRIVVAGYAGDGYEALLKEGWTEERWTAQGGYSNRNKKNRNRNRERLWVSPHCLRGQTGLFDGIDES